MKTTRPAAASTQGGTPPVRESSSPARESSSPARESSSPARESLLAPTVDLLRIPLLGRFLKWHHSRTVLQIPLFLVSLIMIAHAFFGPDLAPKNLATLLTWVHFRGIVVVVILLAGNLFCMACPFMLPRDLARRFFKPRWSWPRKLRNKWPAIILFVGVLFVYELFDLFSDPFWTGVMIVAYFAAALVVDTLFRNASFCKYVCPVGQFNFLSSTIAPLEVAVRDHNVCTTCRTHDCIRGKKGLRIEGLEGLRVQGLDVGGSEADVDSRSSPQSLNPSIPLTLNPSTPQPLNPFNPQTLKPSNPQTLPLPLLQRGCELALFQPRKVGNLDCTFCLDCVYACPHDNVGIVSRLPAEELTLSGVRSGLGRPERRFDFTALTIVFTFGALLNAFAMISPVYALEQSVATITGLKAEWPILAGLFAVALILEPAILLGGAAAITRRLTGSTESVLALVNRFARSLIPLGFGIWLAHYGFHFFTGCLTIIPVTQNAVIHAFGWSLLGEPQWQLGGLPERIVFPMEVGFMSLGVLGSWLVAWSIAKEMSPSRAWPAFASWAVVDGMLFIAALWIMKQPMVMRGTFLG